MRKNIVYAASAFVLLILLAAGLNKYNPYLRTDIFRSFAKGNWHITAEKDTIYTMGYYGARKYIATDPENLQLLAENDEFCKDRIMGRGGCVNGEYLYVTARSFLPGSVNSNGNNGKLLIMKKSNLSIVKELASEIKLVEAKTYEDILVVSGLWGFNVYDCSVSADPKMVFSYRHDKYREYQGFDFVKKDDQLYVAFTLFAGGLEIWNLTEPKQAKMVSAIPIDKEMSDEANLPGGQSMAVVVNYPYLYATLGPTTETFKTEKDRRGILVYDISNIDSVKKSAVFIPMTDWYSKNTGDKQPTYITEYNDKLYVSFAEKGVAVFDITYPAKPRYEGTNDVSGEGALIQPVFVTGEGKLFAGSYYWGTIYGRDINKGK